MVGRTPEYVGKKIEGKEVKMAMLAMIATAFSILVLAAISSLVRFPAPAKDAKGQTVAKSYWNPPGAATANLNNAGAHGFSENLYAYTSGTANNGRAFAGLNADTPWYNLTLGLAMLIGRFFFLIPLLAAAGSLAVLLSPKRFKRTMTSPWTSQSSIHMPGASTPFSATIHRSPKPFRSP
jgi:K+-transporting ATPase ATPase A chain